MFANVQEGSLNFFVFVLVQVYLCVSGFLFACAYRKVVLTQSSAARQPSGWGSPSPVLSGRYVLGCPARAARKPWPVLPARLASSTRAVDALLHATPGACFFFVVCCSVGVHVADVGMYVSMVLRVVRAVVCCSVAIIPTLS